MITERDLKKRYELFNSGDLDRIMTGFAPGAAYIQVNTDQRLVGSQKIRQFLARWSATFKGAQIGNIKIKRNDQRLDFVEGAVQCFEVSFVGTGRYEQNMPGLRGAPSADGREVQLPITEAVWLGANGQYLCVENQMDVSALR